MREQRFSDVVRKSAFWRRRPLIVPLPFSEIGPLLRLDLGDGWIVDVGAHAGSTAWPFATRGDRVLCFEPEAENRGLLEDRLGHMSNVRIVSDVVGEVSGERVPFYVSDVHWGIHGLAPFHASHGAKFTALTINLTDALAREAIDAVQLLKVDVEGADLPVLRGLDFGKVRPRAIVAEFMDRRSLEYFDWRLDDLYAFLRERGYRVWVSAWEEVKRYHVKGERADLHRWLGVNEELRRAPWGNVIAVDEAYAHGFESALAEELRHLRLKRGLSVAKGIVRRTPVVGPLLSRLRSGGNA